MVAAIEEPALVVSSSQALAHLASRASCLVLITGPKSPLLKMEKEEEVAAKIKATVLIVVSSSNNEFAMQPFSSFSPLKIVVERKL